MAANMHNLPRVIHLAGADGTGKTTQARAVRDWLEAQGVRTHYVWLRYPRYVSVPFLAYARLRGYSHQEMVEGTQHGYWNFERSWIMTHLFPWALLIDAFIIGLIGIYVPLLRGLTVVCDRFVGDILVDMMVGIKDMQLDTKLPGRWLLRLLPARTQMVVLELDTLIARQRSPELAGDRSQPLRRAAYLELATRQGWALVSSNAPLGEVSARIIALLEDQAMPAKQPHYAKMDTTWLGPVLEHPAGALASHWLFQGMLGMDNTERAFKLSLDAVLWLLFSRVFRVFMPLRRAIALGFILAHSVNFLFNGQVFGVLKHYGLVRRTWDEFDLEVQALRQRMASQPDIVYAAAYGSLARGAWSPTSDLDVRVVRAPGLRSALRVSWWAVSERTRALVGRFPLDLLVLDDCESLDSMAEKQPVVLVEAETGLS